MAGPHPAITAHAVALPLPRRPLDPSDQVRRWYENELGWPVVPGLPGPPGSPGSPVSPLRLRVGVRFDVLDVPTEAGRAALRHLTPDSPVAVQGDRMRLLVAPGSAEEVPGVLDWLEWGALPLDLRALGEGDLMEAPLPPRQASGQDPDAGSVMAVRPLGTLRAATAVGHAGRPAGHAGPAAEGVRHPVDTGPRGAVRRPGPVVHGGVRPLPLGRSDAVQGAAVWLRPPEPGGEVEASLPTLSALGGGGSAPDLVRILDTVATQCHRLWLRRACAQPSASA